MPHPDWEDFDRYRDTALPLHIRRRAFERLVRDRWAYVEKAAKRVISEIFDVPPRGLEPEQLTNDAFEVLGRRAEKVKGSALNFIWGTLRNLVLQYRDRSRKSLDHKALSFDALLVHPPSQSRDDEEGALKRSKRISELLLLLEDNQREVVELHHNDGYGFMEIDAILGLKPGTARQRYHRAKKILAVILEPVLKTDELAVEGGGEDAEQ